MTHAWLAWIGLGGSAWAQEAESSPAGEPVDEASAQVALEEQVAQLQAALDEATSEATLSSEQLEALNQLLGDTTILLDDRAGLSQRTAAAERLADETDPRALPFVRAASRDRHTEVRALAISIAVRWRNDEVVALLMARVHRDRNEVNRTAAIHGLRDLGLPAAGDALYRLALNEELAAETRLDAREALEQGYPALVKERGLPAPASDRLGATLGIMANGLVGGISLASVGVWGQSNAGIGIGALGGTAIGVGTGTLYNKQNPLSLGQGARYSSNVAWGTTGAIILTDVTDVDEDGAALLLTLGSGAGAALGYRAMDRMPDAGDVMETNLAGYLGLQIARSSVALSMGDVDCDYSEPDLCDAQRDRRRGGLDSAMLAGAAGGLALGHYLGTSWSPDGDDIYFAGVLATEAAWVGGWLPLAFNLDRDAAPFVNFGLHGGLTASLALAHHMEIGANTTSMMGYGILAGNSLGAGLALIPANSQEETIVRSMLATGVIGAGAGAWAAPRLETSKGDQTMVGVGTGLAMLQTGHIAMVLEDRGVLQHSDQSVGLVLSSGALSSAGLLALSPHVEPEPLDSLFLASTAAWGYWYSGLGMVALDSSLDDSARLLVLTGCADVAMGVGSLILWDGTGIQPRDTLLPQLFGVGGATMGSLLVALASEDGQTISWGAIGGSSAGLALGTYLSMSRDLGRADAMPSSPGLVPDRLKLRMDIPGEWSISALPLMQEDGSIGGQFSLSGVGF